MAILDNIPQFMSANASFKQHFKDANLKIAPVRRAAVITCMDARVPIESALGLKNGDALVLRNAGGRVTPDVVRSLAMAQALGAGAMREIFVVHHVDCGMTKLADAQVSQVLAEKLGKAAKNEIKHMKWLTFKDLETSLAEDIELLRGSPLISDTIAIHGLIYDVWSQPADVRASLLIKFACNRASFVLQCYRN